MRTAAGTATTSEGYSSDELDDGPPATSYHEVRHPIQSRDDRAPPSGVALPEGWTSVPSKSRPGAVTYKHLETGARTTEVPTMRNQEHLIAWSRQHRRAVGEAKAQKKSTAESSGGGEGDKGGGRTAKNQSNPMQKSGDPMLPTREFGESDSSEVYSSDSDHDEEGFEGD